MVPMHCSVRTVLVCMPVIELRNLVPKLSENYTSSLNYVYILQLTCVCTPKKLYAHECSSVTSIRISPSITNTLSSALFLSPPLCFLPHASQHPCFSNNWLTQN